MRFVVLALVLSGCASSNIYHKHSTIKENDINYAYGAAQLLFEKYVDCKAPPSNTPLVVKDADLAQLNFMRSVFQADGIYLIQGDYEPKTNTVRVAIEHPDRQFVLFHELLHFMFMESPNCNKYHDPHIQHTIIHYFEDIFIRVTKRDRKVLEDGKWAMEALKKYQ